MTLQSDSRTGTVISPFAARLALVPIVGVAVFSLCVISLHLLRPELDPSETALSYYGIGAHGYLLTIANVALGLGVLVLAFELGRDASGRAWRIGNALLYSSGILIILTGIFSIDALNADASLSGAIHVAAGNLAFFFIPLSTLVLSFGMRQDTRWHPTYPLALALALVLLVVASVLIISPPEISGLVQRALYIPFLAWVALVPARVPQRRVEK